MRSILLLATLALLPIASAATAARELDVAGAQVKRTEVRYGQIGPRDTLLFYAFNDKAAVLVLQIHHQGGKFGMKGAVHLFAEGTTEEQMGKWINNQHSCGLFPDVPEPVATEALAADVCRIASSERKEGAEHVKSPMGEAFEDHVIKFNVTGAQVEGRFTLKPFKAETGSFVKVGPPA